MAIKKCPRGHIYDTSIYGNNCPFCPGSHQQGKGNYHFAEEEEEPKTEATSSAGGFDDEKTTFASFNGGEDEPKTTIHGSGNSGGRKLMAVLATYSETVNPNGEIFKVYEGRTRVGRESSCDISISSDSEISARHFTIVSRPQDDGSSKFFLQDDMTNNGTRVNGQLEDEKVEIKSFDRIQAGNTSFIFIVIPR